MSVVDLHPEELLDRYSAGDLTDTETLRLRAHADTCTACRFEIDARVDFAADIATSRISVTPLLAPAEGRERAAAPARASRRSRKPVWLLAAAITLLAGGSLAAVALRVVPWSAPKTEQTPAAAPAAQPSAPRSSHAVSRAAHEESAAPTSVPFEALPVAAERTPQEPARAKVDHSASELFHEATAARTRGDTARAVALYRTLEAGYPRSPEARLSYAMLARLLLDRGDARSALDGFDSYLSQGGAAQALGEEALVGRALALQKLGAQGGEVAAWQEVLRRFPSSVHARLARSRLSALGAR